MSPKPLLKIKAATAAEICGRFDLKKEARMLLRDGTMAPREFVNALAANKQYITGIDFVAHALPSRESIWWGCLCLQHACGDALAGNDRAACKAAVQWVLAPSESAREAATAPAQAAGLASPAGALAAAVAQTGGNIAPPGAPPMAPPPYAPAKAVANAVKLASTKRDPVKIVETHRLFLELGLGVAEGRFL